MIQIWFLAIGFILGAFGGAVLAPISIRRSPIFRAINARQTAVGALYCWPCKDVHVFSPDDVERIVYALGADVVQADGSAPERGEPDCLGEVLGWARSAELYAEHVEQGIECRKATPDA